ncbi:MAG: SsrA-binding protein [Actinomycetota bacterium]
MTAFAEPAQRLYQIPRSFSRPTAPLRLYFARGTAKIELGLAKGKKNYDKREDLKAADAKGLSSHCTSYARSDRHFRLGILS